MKLFKKLFKAEWDRRAIAVGILSFFVLCLSIFAMYNLNYTAEYPTVDCMEEYGFDAPDMMCTKEVLPVWVEVLRGLFMFLSALSLGGIGYGVLFARW